MREIKPIITLADVEGLPRSFELLTCECGAKFFFVPSEKDKPIPLQEKPNPKGNIFILGGRAIYISKRNPLPEHAGDGDRYTSHFADCPKAEQFRTPKDT